MNKEVAMNKEVEDALCMLLHCALKDKGFTTQKEQYAIVRNYIDNLEQALNDIKIYINELPTREYVFDSFITSSVKQDILQKIG